jgi:hypothetical protein
MAAYHLFRSEELEIELEDDTLTFRRFPKSAREARRLEWECRTGRILRAEVQRARTSMFELATDTGSPDACALVLHGYFPNADLTHCVTVGPLSEGVAKAAVTLLGETLFLPRQERPMYELPFEQLMENLTAYDQVLISTTGWWQNRFRFSAFGTCWLEPPELCAIAQGDHYVRLVAWLESKPRHSGYGHQGAWAAQLDAYSVEIVTPPDRAR